MYEVRADEARPAGDQQPHGQTLVVDRLDLAVASASTVTRTDVGKEVTTAMTWSIQQVARVSGVTARTLRYYDEIGLLRPDSLGSNGYRYY